MSNGINITLFGDEELVARLSAKGDLFLTSMRQAIYSLVLKVKNNVVLNHLSGPTGDHSLSRQTGALARSVQTDVNESDAAIVGRIFYTGDVPYAAIHEFGGDIYPVKANALKFMIGGKMILAQHVHMPERAPLRTGFREMQDQIIDQLKSTVAEVLSQ